MIAVAFSVIDASAQPENVIYDIVLKGGRVMDPETGLDAVRNVGIRDDRIVEISPKALKGKEVINVSGLVVSPGFIDLHTHGKRINPMNFKFATA